MSSRRRSSATLTLVLIGAALPGCGDGDPPSARDVYRSQADCQRDWGDAAGKCEQQSSGSHRGYWFGPSYGYSGSSTSSGSTVAARPGSHAMASTVSRGGFGSSASSHSSGG